MKRCPHCQLELGEGLIACPRDGTLVVDQARTEARLGLTLLGRWQLQSVLGHGGFGTVYQAHDTVGGGPAAVKVLHSERAADPAMVARFTTEAHAAATLAHPGVVPVVDFGWDPQGGWCLVMPLLQGETLGERLRRVGTLPLPELEVVVPQLLAALGHAHARGVVHRDVQVDNVFLSHEATLGLQARLLDFGVAQIEPPVQPADSQTEAGPRPRQVVGSAWSMAPEQIMGGAVDGRTDLYALGVLLFECITGEPPFRADRPGLVMRAHVHEPAPAPSERRHGRWVTLHLDALVGDLMAKRAARRPADAQEVLQRWQVVLPELRAAWQRHHADRP